MLYLGYISENEYNPDPGLVLILSGLKVLMSGTKLNKTKNRFNIYLHIYIYFYLHFVQLLN